MKFFLLFLFSIPLSVYSQTATIKELKFKPNTKFYNTKDFTIIFPVVITQNKISSKLINSFVSDELLSTSAGNLKNRLEELINDGLTDLSYEVTFNKNDILSLHIYMQESGGNHLTSSETYFNFNLKTGKKLSISDLFYKNKIDSFRKMIFSNKRTSLLAYKREVMNDLVNNVTDSETYTWAVEQIDSNCITNVQVENFSLSNQYIEIIDPCEFPYVIRSLEPIYKLKYSYKSILSFLKPEFQKKLFR